MVTKKTDHTHVKLFFVEMYRLSIVIGVIIVVLLASPVPCVRGKPPECWGVIPGVVSCDCSIIGFMANYGFNKLEARILITDPGATCPQCETRTPESSDVVA